MGLDVYVGSLTRYYRGDWETIVQQIGRQQGLEVQIDRPAEPKPNFLRRMISRVTRRTGSDACRKAIDGWRRSLGEASLLGDEFDWNESLEYEYFTDKPAWDCYGALVLWACYEQMPKATRATVGGSWSADPAYQAVRSLSAHRYPHLIDDTEFWFPVEFQEPFQIKTILNTKAAVGSSIRLLQELAELNQRTWHATPELISEWRTEGAEYGAPLERSAQFAFSIFHELAHLSVQHRLPMKLDY